MNFAWTHRCDWDSSLLCDCKLSLGLGPSHGSLFLLCGHCRRGAHRQ